jgi:hypothetical protein
VCARARVCPPKFGKIKITKTLLITPRFTRILGLGTLDMTISELTIMQRFVLVLSNLRVLTVECEVMRVSHVFVQFWVQNSIQAGSCFLIKQLDWLRAWEHASQ